MCLHCVNCQVNQKIFFRKTKLHFDVKLLTKKHVNIGNFRDSHRLFFGAESGWQLMNKRRKPSPAQTGYKWVGLEVWDWIIYKFSMGCQTRSKWYGPYVHWYWNLCEIWNLNSGWALGYDDEYNGFMWFLSLGCLFKGYHISWE